MTQILVIQLQMVAGIYEKNQFDLLFKYSIKLTLFLLMFSISLEGSRCQANSIFIFNYAQWKIIV